MNKILATGLAVVLCAGSAFGEVLEGGRGLGLQISKYLLDRGVDAAAAYRNKDVVVVADGDVERVIRWTLTEPVPALEQLDTVDEAREVLRTPPGERKQVDGRWTVKPAGEVAAEVAASPAGKKAAQLRGASRKLAQAAQTAGFTNQVYSVADLDEWLDSAGIPQAQENKIMRRLSVYSLLGGDPDKIEAAR